MSKQLSNRPPMSRSTAIVTSAVLGVIAAALLLVFVIHLSHTKGGKVQIGETEFKIPIKVTRLVTDADRAPLFFPDARGRSLDIYVSHLGSDPRRGWQAFEAHAPGVGRSCDVQWLPAPRAFRDPCAGRTYPEDGTGLLHYAVRIDNSDHLIVDFQQNIGESPQTASTVP
jgi:hypothetical protein